ncbi:MAG: DUF362 domain-containing protein [Candidatus Bathyarchaeota archaeon]|nr:DUF362 domain-containing protein [Candidatus Bathyarchaeota archaeon]
MTKPKVYYGSIMHGQGAQFASLGAKHDEIMNQLDFSTIKKKDKVAIKMHLGFKDGFQTVPVFFIRRIVKKLKEVGAYPFVTDNPTAVYNAVDRGYTQETCGCPIIPFSGIKDGYHYKTEINYRTVDYMNMGGVLHDADALIDVSHVKGHGTCGYGGAFKNLALGAYCGKDRWHKIHGVESSVPWFDEEKLTPEHVEKLTSSCPMKAMTWDKKKKKLNMSWYLCRNTNCLECLKADEEVGALSLGPDNFAAFHELMTIATQKVLETFDLEKVFYLNYLLDITPQCDCTGFGQPIVVPDIGIVGGKDIVAVEEASLDLIKQTGLIPDMVPKYIKRYNLDPDTDLHPFQQIWGAWKNPYLVCEYGEKLGMGSRDYELIEILSPEETAKMDPAKIVYEDQPTFF